MKIIQISILTLLLIGLAFAQDVRLSYQLNTTEEGTMVEVYAESYTEASVDLAALNLSFAYNEGCQAVGTTQSMLLESWTDYLSQRNEVEGLALNHSDLTFTSRLQWGNANPGLPQTAEVILAPKGNRTLLLMQAFKGACQDIYLEHASENPLNELGDPAMNSMNYVIEHPERPVVAQFDVELSVFPNPTTDFVTLEAKGLTEGTYSVRLTDLHGRLIQTRSVEWSPSGVEVTLDINKKAAGVYILDLVSEENPFEAKAVRVVKE